MDKSKFLYLLNKIIKCNMIRIVTILFFISNSILCQSFISSFFPEGDRGSGKFCIQTSDGGYLIAGTDFQDYDRNILIIKTNSLGQEDWRVSYGTPEYVENLSIDFFENDSPYDNYAKYYVSFYVQDMLSGYYNKTVIILGLTGDIVYSSTNEDFVIPNTHPENDIPLIPGSVHYEGNYSTIVDGTTYDYGSTGGLNLTDDIHYIDLIGRDSNESFNGGFRLVKGEKITGEVIWDKIILDFQCAKLDPFFMNEDSNGDLLICGTCRNIENSIYGFFTKINLEGEILWFNVYPQNFVNRAYLGHFSETNDGNYILTGTIGTVYFTNVYKVNSNGEILSYHSFPFTETRFVGTAGQETFDGGFILTGSYIDSFGIEKIGLMKIDSEGNLNLNDNVYNNNRNIIRKINILGQTTINFSNNIFFEIYDDGSVEKRLIIE